MMMSHLVKAPLLSTALAAMLGMVLLGATSPATAQSFEFPVEDSEIDRPAQPYYCEKWQALIDERLASEDSLERSLGEIYGTEDFSWCQTQRVRVREERESRWDFKLPGLTTLAEIMRLLAIVSLVALVIWAVWRWRRQLGEMVVTVSQRRRNRVEAARHEPVSAQIELPPDVSAGARELWNQGLPREAVSLLYRGALAQLLAHVRSGESRTEREVQRLLRGQGLKPTTLAYMDKLISCWQRTAWAHQPPGSDEFEQLLEAWPRNCLQTNRPGARP